MTASAPTHSMAVRHILHACLGIAIAGLGLIADRQTLLPLLGVLTALAFAIETLRFALPDMNAWLTHRFGPLVKARERRAVSGATYLVLSALLTFALFDARIAALAVAYTAWGDPLASIVGGRAGHWRWRGKSMEGAFAFLVGGAAAGLLLGPLGANISLAARLLGAASAAVIELLPLRLDDNITAPAGSAIVMALVVALASGA